MALPLLGSLQLLLARHVNPLPQGIISIGGGSFSPDIWSEMAATAATRAKFVASVVSWLQTYQADGIDLDWEFPSGRGRGGWGGAGGG